LNLSGSRPACNCRLPRAGLARAAAAAQCRSMATDAECCSPVPATAAAACLAGSLMSTASGLTVGAPAAAVSVCRGRGRLASNPRTEPTQPCCQHRTSPVSSVPSDGQHHFHCGGRLPKPASSAAKPAGLRLQGISQQLDHAVGRQPHAGAHGSCTPFAELKFARWFPTTFPPAALTPANPGPPACSAVHMDDGVWRGGAGGVPHLQRQHPGHASAPRRRHVQ